MAESQWHENASQDPKRRLYFEAIVLQALWVLIMCAFGMKPRAQALDFRQTAIDYMDANGREGEAPRAYRREHTFANLQPTKD